MVLKDRSHYLGIKTADFKSPFRCLEKEKAGVGAHTFNPSAWEAEAGRALSSSLVHRVSSRDAQKNPVLKNKQKERKKERKEKKNQNQKKKKRARKN